MSEGCACKGCGDRITDSQKAVFFTDGVYCHSCTCHDCGEVLLGCYRGGVCDDCHEKWEKENE